MGFGLEGGQDWVLTSSAWWAGALEVVHKVNTGASILAWLILALVHFVFTVDTLISWYTLSGGSQDKTCLQMMTASDMWTLL